MRPDQDRLERRITARKAGEDVPRGVDASRPSGLAEQVERERPSGEISLGVANSIDTGRRPADRVELCERSIESRAIHAKRSLLIQAEQPLRAQDGKGSK